MQAGGDSSLTPDERARLERLEKRLAASADQIEQAIDLVDRLADSGVLAGNTPISCP